MECIDPSVITERNERLKRHMLSLAERKTWEKTIALTDDSLAALEQKTWLAEIDTVFLVGHGTSYATSLNGESWMAHIARLNARAVPAFQFCNYADDYLIRPSKTLVIGISSGGNTISVIKSVEVARASGAVTLCVSGESDIGLAKVAEHRIVTDAHIEKTATVSAYSISHLFLALAVYKLAILIGLKRGALREEQAADWHKALGQTLASMNCLPVLFEEVKDIASSIAATCIPNFAVLGTGPNFGTMIEGALKISEFSWMFGAGEELEDFSHGRFREVDNQIPLFILSPNGPACEKTMDLLAGSAIACNPTVVFTDAPTPAMEKLATHIVKMPKLANEYLTPFFYIIPLWFYGYHVSEAAGNLVGYQRHGLFAYDIDFKAHYDERGNKL